MFEMDHTLQGELSAFSHRDLVSFDSDVWLYIDLFELLDLREFREIYSRQGQVAKDPELMLRTIFYGLTHGVVSGRKLEEVCRNDNRFIVLSGRGEPDCRTFHRFIERHRELMSKLFVKVVRLAQEMELVNLGRVAIDGSRFKGKTSKYKQMKYEKMQRAITHIEEELKKLRADLSRINSGEATELETKLPKEIRRRAVRLEKIKRAMAQIEQEHKDKVRAVNEASPRPNDQKSLNDPEALSLSHKNGSFMFGYNAQIAVEEKNQIVVAATIHDKATDYEALPELLEQTQDNCADVPAEVVADLGYKSVDNVMEIEKLGAAPIVAVGSDPSNEAPQEFFEQIQPTGVPHEYKCLRGEIIPIEARRKNGRTDFRLTKEFCKACPFAQKCKAYGKKTISIMPEAERAAMARLYSRARTDQFKESYRQRKRIVEPVFGNIKNKGLRILVTGKKKVSTWWIMACTAHNIEKIVPRMNLAPT